MKLPRDLSGQELAKLLRRFGYEIVRQEGSHLRLTSSHRGFPHHITIPNHKELRIGTLRAVLRLVAEYLEQEAATVIAQVFED